MLVIRMQRTGRKGHAQFRVVVQDSRRTPTSGRVVAALGSYDPHTKQTTLNKEKTELYLKNGAQPSDRVIRLLKAEKVALPSWVKDPTTKAKTTRSTEKLRKNRPAEEKAPVESPVEEPAAEPDDEVVATEDTPTTDAKTEESASEPTEEKPEVTEVEEAPAETAKEEPEAKEEKA